MSNTPSLAELGDGTVKQVGHSAIGGRPLLIVLGEYSNYPAFKTVHSLQYYELLGFGNPVSLFSTQNPVNPASLHEYFRENINGIFWLDRVAVIGPIQLGIYSSINDPRPEARSAGILSRVADLAPKMFINADTNQDQHVGFDELCIVLFGDLHWYSYNGNGEHDPSGTFGWHPRAP